MSVQQSTSKLWTRNYLLLWQGQFVSTLGDVLYDMAMGLWILFVTGSTALMGTLMAASILPRVVMSPFAGVVVDRSERKYLMVFVDLVRGALIVFISLAAFKGCLTIWMVFGTGITLGIGSAFFSPAVTATIPDIVHPSNLFKANSAFGMIQAGSSIVGKPLGGILYQFLGAPFMFLLNGLSYLISGIATIFLDVPKTEKHISEKHFWQDMKEGYLFVWQLRGLRYIIIILSIVSFIGSVANILFLPLFQLTEGLGPVRLGIAIAFLTAGTLIGMLVLSVVDVPAAMRFRVFVGGASVSFIAFIGFGLITSFPGMVLMLFIGGILSSVFSVFMPASIHLVVPPEMRGKVFSLAGMLTQGLMPIGMGLGGILGEFIPLRTIIVAAYAMQLLVFLSIAFIPSFKRYIDFDPANQTVEDIR